MDWTCLHKNTNPPLTANSPTNVQFNWVKACIDLLHIFISHDSFFI